VVKNTNLARHRRIIKKPAHLAAERMGNGQIQPDGRLPGEDDLVALAGQRSGAL
jgi:hypothetical protein